MTRRTAGMAAIALAIVSAAGAAVAGAQARRIVDVVTVGVPASEREHEFSGDRVSTGAASGRTYREALGWQRYVLTIYEDSDVTLVCTFRGTAGQPRPFALEVDGTAVPVKPFLSPSSDPVDVEIQLPAALTRRRTAIAVTFRASDGPTPALMQLRTVQEHLEVW